jgi:hypothetical protein
VSIALSELEQPHDRYLARSSQWDRHDPVTMTAVTGGFKANQDQP